VKAHVMMDTPLRDMLSRAAHEFLYCQEERDCGVLILSEFSGSAQSLRAAAVCVNPWDTNAFADAVQEALEMEPLDRRELYRYGHRYVIEHTLRNWAMSFYDELQTAETECENERLQIPPQLDHDKPVAALRKASQRIIILGFSGTLLPRKSKIHAKILPKLPSVLIGNLQVLAQDPNTHVVVTSGFSRNTLSQSLGNVPCWIIAEGGVCYREPGGDAWHTTTEQRDNEWLAPVKEIMQYFAARTPGSNVIETSSSVSWHYQKTQGDHAAIQSKDLLIHLWAGPLLSAPAEVVVGNDSVSVRPTGVGKALQLERVLQQICSEGGESSLPKWLNSETFVMCISDLMYRDEDVFTTVQKFFDQENSEKVSVQASAIERERAVRNLSGDLDMPLHKQDDLYLEANSKSLGNVYGRLQMVSHPVLDAELDFKLHSHQADGPFGLHKSETSFSEAGARKKTPSEPDLQADSLPEGWETLQKNDGNPNNMVSLFTCTVNRKPTRAAYHLSDTNDVAFLIAKFAREVRQAKQVAEGNSEHHTGDGG